MDQNYVWGSKEKPSAHILYLSVQHNSMSVHVQYKSNIPPEITYNLQVQGEKNKADIWAHKTTFLSLKILNPGGGA